LALSSNNLVLLGAIPAALLALIVDFSIAAMEWSLQSRKYRRLPHRLGVALRTLAFLLPFFIGVGGFVAYLSGAAIRPVSKTTKTTGEQRPKAKLVIASKNFTEQFILGELMAQLIEEQTELTVVRRFNLGGTMICHGGLLNGEIDVYAEYTGTGLTAILKKTVISDPEEAFKVVKREYRNRFQIEWLQPFGFNNTYAITVRGKDAETHGWKNISDLAATASNLRAGFTSEFAERPDGYPGLRKVYGYRFGEVRDLDPTLNGRSYPGLPTQTAFR
jgi:osmoprotectant transport system permease protein